MIVVLDASVALNQVFPGKSQSQTRSLLLEADWIIAPGLFIAEVANASWKYHQFADVPFDQCQEAMEKALSFPDDFFWEADLYKEAFGMACATGKTVYDMAYLVLARRNNAILLTSDKELRKVAEKHSVRVA